MFTFLMRHSAEVGLLMFVVSFLLILFFALTRTRKELDSWANLPLSAGSSAAEQSEDKP